MIHYKFTDQNLRTYGGTCQWEVGVPKYAPGGAFCTADVLHGYRDPLLAEFMNPVYGDFDEHAILWRADGDEYDCDGTQSSFTRQVLLKQIKRPAISTDQRVEIAIRCVMQLYERWPGSSEWHVWAKAWLSGADRSAEAARRVIGGWLIAGAYDAAFAAIAAAQAATKPEGGFTEIAAEDAAQAAFFAAKEADADVVTECHAVWDRDTLAADCGDHRACQTCINREDCGDP